MAERRRGEEGEAYLVVGVVGAEGFHHGASLFKFAQRGGMEPSRLAPRELLGRETAVPMLPTTRECGGFLVERGCQTDSGGIAGDSRRIE